MTIIEDELRAALHAQAQSLRVPERPELDRVIVEPRFPGGPRWLVAAACLALITAGVAALVLWPAGDPEPAPPVATVVPDTTTPAAPVTTGVVDTTEPAPPSTSDATALIPGVNGWIALDSVQSDGRHVYLVRPGENARRLEVAGSTPSSEACPTWSPDGTLLMFGRVTASSDSASNGAELVIVPVGVDGSASAPKLIALDGFVALDGFDPHPCAIWAPDGRWVAFAGNGDVWVVDIQTDEIRRLPNLRPSDLEWRPGTDQLAIAGDMGANRSAPTVSTPVSVYTVSTDSLQQLGSVEAAVITWSPDGSTLAYQGGESDPDELWLVDADGANERSLLTDLGEAIHGIGPVWSPTGERIAYQRLECDTTTSSCGERHEVVLVSVANGDQNVIEPPETDGPTGPVTWYPYSVTWSPDGSTLLYTAWTGGDTDIVGGTIAVLADTPSSVTVLSDDIGQGDDYSHRWAPVQRWGQQVQDGSGPIDTASTTPSTAATTSPPPEREGAAQPGTGADVDAFLNGFLDARVAGAGAQQYLRATDGDIPLLYSTSSGASYERAEFEPVSGFEWPYGWTAYTVRLFAGDTVVEQLLFTSGAPPSEIAYQPNGFGTHIAPTAENGQPIAVPVSLFDGAATMQVGHPWIFSRGTYGRLIPEGSGVTPSTDGGQRNGWDELFVMADAAPVGGCGKGPAATDVEALADSIQSDSALGATEPVEVSVGGVDGLMMDLAVAATANICTPTDGQGGQLTSSILSPIFDQDAELSIDNINGIVRGRATGEMMRLYLFDAPERSAVQVLTIAIVAPLQSFERAVDEAAPIIESLEFDAV